MATNPLAAFANPAGFGNLFNQIAALTQLGVSDVDQLAALLASQGFSAPPLGVGGAAPQLPVPNIPQQTAAGDTLPSAAAPDVAPAASIATRTADIERLRQEQDALRLAQDAVVAPPPPIARPSNGIGVVAKDQGLSGPLSPAGIRGGLGVADALTGGGLGAPALGALIGPQQAAPTLPQPNVPVPPPVNIPLPPKLPPAPQPAPTPAPEEKSLISNLANVKLPEPLPAPALLSAPPVAQGAALNPQALQVLLSLLNGPNVQQSNIPSLGSLLSPR